MSKKYHYTKSEVEKQIKAQELAAQDYTEALILKREKVNKGEIMEVEAMWQEWLLNWLKTQALTFIGEHLHFLKLKGIEWTVELANWLLEQLNQIILNLYRRATVEEKQAFKNKMLVSFPNSDLLNKLK